MYLAISAVSLMFAALAGMMAQKAKRLGEDLRKKTMEAESFEMASKANEQRLRAEKLVHAQLVERCTKVEQALRESEDTACRLRQEVQTGRKSAKQLQEELDATKQAHDACINAMWSARNEVDGLKQERRKLEQALITEREAAEHWKEEFLKEQAYRLSTEGRIMREVNNLLRYDGTANGQEELSDG